MRCWNTLRILAQFTLSTSTGSRMSAPRDHSMSSTWSQRMPGRLRTDSMDLGIHEGWTRQCGFGHRIGSLCWMRSMHLTRSTRRDRDPGLLTGKGRFMEGTMSSVRFDCDGVSSQVHQGRAGHVCRCGCTHRQGAASQPLNGPRGIPIETPFMLTRSST